LPRGIGSDGAGAWFAFADLEEHLLLAAKEL